MRRLQTWPWLAVATLLSWRTGGGPLPLSAAPPAAPAETREEANIGPEAVDGETKFIRLARDDAGELAAMQTSIVRYVRPADDKQAEAAVDLVGVVHVGERTYYEELNKELGTYQALLFELVAPEGAKIEKGRKSDSPVSALQTGLKDVLKLEFQLDHIDYGQSNFVHADMSPEELSKAMEDRGETIWSMLLEMMGRSIAIQSQNPNAASDVELLMALFDRNRAVKLKRLLARQFEDLETATAVLEGPDGSVLIADRNKKAFEVLRRELKDGKVNLGIFYGAGHLPDMEKRLIDMGFSKQGERWLTAWNLEERSAKKNTPAKQTNDN